MCVCVCEYYSHGLFHDVIKGDKRTVHVCLLCACITACACAYAVCLSQREEERKLEGKKRINGDFVLV